MRFNIPRGTVSRNKMKGKYKNLFPKDLSLQLLYFFIFLFDG